MNKKIKVLVITYLPWRNDTSVGNSYSNIFDGMDDKFEFAHIYFRDGMPENNLVHRYFHISEKGLMKSIFSRRPVGKAFMLDNPMTTKKVTFSKYYNRMRQLRWEIFLYARDLVGLLGKWKTRELHAFVDDFNPDLIFGTLGYVPVINRIMIYLKHYLSVPLITYPWDDYYSLKRVSFSPFFWGRNLSERPLIKKCAIESEFLYTITAQMQQEYTHYFKKDCRLLYKGYDFSEEPNFRTGQSDLLKIVFMGNIGSGRWKVLEKAAGAIARINRHNPVKINLFIYTLSPTDEKIQKALNLPGSCNLMTPVPNEEVLSTMEAADILLHVEPTTIKDKLFFRLSFSTKIVDYLHSGRCILALGGHTAAMDYLKENKAAVVEPVADKFEEVLLRLANNQNLINEYGKRAWFCGKNNHDIRVIQETIFKDFSETAGKSEE